jgi:hypothetical protein
VLIDICFIFCDNYILISIISIEFSQLKVWKYLSHRLDCSCLLLIFTKDTWPLVDRMTAKDVSNSCPYLDCAFDLFEC